MEVSDDSGDNTALCWINHKTDFLEEYKANEIKEELQEDVPYMDPELDLKPDLIQCGTELTGIGLLKVPVVYTTKLEEMNVFKRKFDDISMQCFTERVYEESKPKYNCASFQTEQKRSHRRDGFLPSPLYGKMEKKIRTINKKCVSENFGNPLLQYSAKTDFRKDFKKAEDLPLKPKYARALLVKDKQLNTIDIFITTKESKITQHYYIVCGESLPVKLSMVSLSENVVCCWYTREEFFLSQNINFNHHNNVVRLGRRPHGCVQNKCKCCCKHQQSVVSDSANEFNLLNTVDPAIKNLKENIHNSISKTSNMAVRRVLNAQNNYSFKNIFSKVKPSSSPHKLIVETLNYNTPLKQKQICGLTYKKKDNLKGKLIHLTNKKTKELEFYELDNDGNVCAHAQFIERTVADDYLLDFNKPKIVANICCWVKREIIISKLVTKQLSDGAIKFIRRPHSCFPGKCICCCYAGSIRKKETLLDISLNKGEHSLNYTMSDKLPKIVSVTSGKNFNDNMSTVNETMTEKATLVQKINQETLLDISVNKGEHSLNYTMSDKLPKIVSVTSGKNFNDNMSTVNETMTEKATLVQKINQQTLLDISVNKGEHSLNYTMSDKLPKIVSVTSGKNFNDNISTVNETMTEKTTLVQKINPTQGVQVSEQHDGVNTSQSNLCNVDTKLLNLISTINTNPKLNQCLNLNAIIERNCLKLVESVQIEKGTVASATEQRIVTAVLETFRNARLTINSEGKVAAALNTPASTLSSIELKVLAHILSNAQNEVNNVLKNNSSKGNEGNAMTLNNSTQIDNSYLNTVQNPVLEAITDKTKIMTPPLMIGESLPTLVDVDKSMLSDLNYTLESKQKHLQHSFRSFNNNLYYERDTNETTKIPQIQNVYSLNDKQKGNKDQTDVSSSATMWYIEPKKKEPPQCSILQNLLNPDLSSSRALLKYKSSTELKRKFTDDLHTLSETETPVKILNSSMSDTDTNSKTPMSRYQIISSNDSKGLKSPNDITLVKSNKKKIISSNDSKGLKSPNDKTLLKSNKKNIPPQTDSSPAILAHTLPTQSNLTLMDLTLEDKGLNTPNPKAIYVVPHNFTEHLATRLKETQQRNEVQVLGAVDLKHIMSTNSSGICNNLPHSTLNSQNHITLPNQNTKAQKIAVDLKHSMLPRPIAPKPPHDANLRIIVPPDTPVKSKMFSSQTKNTNQRKGAIFKISSTKKKRTGDTEVSDQDLGFVVKIGDDNVNMTENVNDRARIATIADGSVINDDDCVIDEEIIVSKLVNKNSVIHDNKINDDDECILGV